MATVQERVHGDAQRRWGTRAGLTSVVLPTAAWLLSLGLSYAIEDLTCAATARRGAAPPADTLQVVLLVLNGGLLLVALLAGALGLYVVVGARRRGSRPVVPFLGYVGAGLAAVYAFGIVLIGWNPLVLEACR